MKTMRMQSRVASFVIAAVLLFQISPALAGGPPSHVVRHHHHDRDDLDITFTKWITITPGYPIMAGFVGGDVVGVFAGELLVVQNTIDGNITRLGAIYGVQAGDHSFTALMQGGQNNVTGTALLDGVILGGWRTGARVHVEYDVIRPCAEPNALFGVCFKGTIHVERDSDD